MMDPATINRLIADHPERYRGGTIDRTRPVGQTVTVGDARQRALRCLEAGNEPRAAYWTGYANEGER